MIIALFQFYQCLTKNQMYKCISIIDIFLMIDGIIKLRTSLAVTVENFFRGDREFIFGRWYVITILDVFLVVVTSYVIQLLVNPASKHERRQRVEVS